MNPQRREFLSRAFATLAGSALLADTARASLLSRAEEIPAPPGEPAQDEAYWEAIKTHFPFADGLHYFNNASLGPSPKLVAEATNEFRRTLDMHPSKYMWGGWSRKKEEVRRRSAGLLGVSPEEIALVHNTTEGMNVVASSLDLKPGDEVILCDHEHASGTIILTERYGIDVRPMTSHGLNGLRISLSIFNSKRDIDYLVHALTEIVKPPPARAPGL